MSKTTLTSENRTQTMEIGLRNVGIPGRGLGRDRLVPVKCQICATETISGVDLGNQPIGDLVLSPSQLNRPETFYPLKLQHCPECGLTQLSYIVNPKIVYKNYPFVSGTTQTATRTPYRALAGMC